MKYNKKFIIIGASAFFLLILYFAFRPEVDAFFYKIFGGSKRDAEGGGKGLDAKKMLKYGSRGPEVAELQRKMLADGANLGSYGPAKDGVDSVFGKMTKSELKRLKGVETISLSGYDQQPNSALFDATIIDLITKPPKPGSGVAGPIDVGSSTTYSDVA